MFPIYVDKKKYAKEAPGRIKLLPAAAQTLIEKLQPYNSAATEELARKSALVALQTLDNADKHHLLTVTAVLPYAGNFVFYIASGAPIPKYEIRGFEVPLEHDAVVAELTFDDDSTPKTSMTAEVVPNVAFGESVGFGPKMAVLSLSTIIQDVTNLATLFKQQFNIAES